MHTAVVGVELFPNDLEWHTRKNFSFVLVQKK